MYPPSLQAVSHPAGCLLWGMQEVKKGNKATGWGLTMALKMLYGRYKASGQRLQENMEHHHVQCKNQL